MYDPEVDGDNDFDDEDEDEGDICDVDPYGDVDDDSPMAKRARRSEMPVSASSFSEFARPVSSHSSSSAEDFMILDVECVTAPVRSDMDDPIADHTPISTPYGPGGKRSHHSSSTFMPGPVFKVYGVCADETSVCIDVYGFYPAFRLQVAHGTPSEQCMGRLRNYIEREVLHQSSPAAPRGIVSACMVPAFTAFPYSPLPSVFYEYRLAKPQSVRVLASHFVNTPEMDDDYSPGGVLSIVPHSADDALTQFMVSSDLCGFGWAGAIGLSDIRDQKRSEIESCTCTRSRDCAFRQIRPNVAKEDDIAPLRVLGIDIECIKDEGMPSAQKDPVIIIGTIACRAVGGIVDQQSCRGVIFTWYPPNSTLPGVSAVPGSYRVVTVESELEMFVAFGAFLTQFDPDVFVGHNIAGFDIPYLVTRANVLGVSEVMYMGRRRSRCWSAPREITRVRKNGDVRKSLRVDTPGRIQLDTLPFMQGLVKESSYSLGALSRKYLGDSKDDVGYQMIKPLWLQSPDTRARLCSYCLKDVQLSLGLCTYERFQMLLSVIELSRGTRVRASQLLRSGNQEKVKTLVLNMAKHPGFDGNDLLPVFFPYETPKSRDKDDKFQGATVINPKRGARKKNVPVAVGDFSSLYPSIMVSSNVCYTTMLHVPKGAKPPDASPAYNSAPADIAHFVKPEVRRGLLPRILEGLLSRRAQAKAMMKAYSSDPGRKSLYNSRQLQLKIIANSVYGVLSASGGWFVRMEMGESVTAWGRSMIAKAMSIAKAPPFNATIVYGDTDSIMMTYPGCTTVPDAFDRLNKVCAAVTAAFPKPVSMAAEKVYEGHLQLGKKRYAGMCHMPGEKPKLDSKGVEKNRLDNTPLVRRMMARVFELLLIDENVDGALKYVHQCASDLIRGKVEYSDLVITKSISRPEYKSKVVHVEVAKRMKARDSSYGMAPGERIPYVIVNVAGKDAKVCDRAEDPLWAIQHGMEIDVHHYIRDISRPIARVMMWYVLPREELDAVHCLEEKIESAGSDEMAVAALEKTLKKTLERMTDETANRLFGPGALADIPRPAQRISGPIAKYFSRPEKKRSRTPADSERLESLRSQLAESKAKCTKCRGREDDSIACVQRDCANLFKVALLSRDIEDLTNSI